MRRRWRWKRQGRWVKLVQLSGFDFISGLQPLSQLPFCAARVAGKDGGEVVGKQRVSEG